MMSKQKAQYFLGKPNSPVWLKELGKGEESRLGKRLGLAVDV